MACVCIKLHMCAWMGLVVHVCKFANDDFRVLDCVRVAKCVYEAVCTLCVCEANTIT